MRDSHKVAQIMERYIDHMGGAIKVKEESRLMRVIGSLMFFNRRFMDYFTIIGRTLYVPKAWIGGVNAPLSYTKTLAHEAAHLYDYNRLGGFNFILLYLGPQIFSVFSVFSIIAIWNVWFLVFLFFLFFILPFPSRGRFHIETRGDALMMAVDMWTSVNGAPGYTPPDWMIKKYLDWSYYKMYPHGDKVKERLQYYVDLTKAGRLHHEIPIATDIKSILGEKEFFS